MLDVRRMHLLRDLSRLGTIAAVAQVHGYTPSAISQQLAALEREAGVPLLRRAGRRVQLTAAGVALVEHTENVLAALEAASAALASVQSGLSGVVRIGAYPTAVPTLLPGALVSLGREHPRLELMVREVDPVDVADGLRQRQLDVALTHDYDVAPGAPDATVESVELLAEQVFLAVPPGTPLSGDLVKAARDQPWIVGSPGTLCHRVAMSAGQVAGFTPRVRHHADDFTAVLALVAAGQGVALVPRLGALRPPPEVRLLPLEMRRRTTVAYRRGAGRHPAVAACVAALRSAAHKLEAELADVRPDVSPDR
jgi:DNA-binding transcriptional LysR family regulator